MPADIFQREDLPFPGSLPEFQRLSHAIEVLEQEGYVIAKQNSGE